MPAFFKHNKSPIAAVNGLEEVAEFQANLTLPTIQALTMIFMFYFLRLVC